jgi:hypothetical protein
MVAKVDKILGQHFSHHLYPHHQGLVLKTEFLTDVADSPRRIYLY